jgi:glycosyltransferase involved in cell wall biosynthesis
VRVLLATSNVPAATHRTAGAIAIVSFEAARAFRDAGHDVVVQPIFANYRREGLTGAERDDLQVLHDEGLRTDEPLQSPPGVLAHQRRAVVRQAFAPTLEAFYPSIALRETVRERVDRLGCDLVFELWSPEALAACSGVDAPVFGYQGNPDHLPETAKLAHPALFGIPERTVRQRAFLQMRKRAAQNWKRLHIELNATTRWTANNSALDAVFYTAHGHPNSHYVQNMWPDVYGNEWRTRREAAPSEERMIVGSIGNLLSTGNTFGLRFLGAEIVPALDRLVGDRYAVHIFGNGTPLPLVAAALEHPRVRMRGWVDDLDAEIAAAEIFLLANNNVEDFRVGHTRVLHAWSLGSCLVAHENIALAMPEVVHGENALLGRTADELAEHLRAVLDDRELRRRLGDAGRATYERSFTPPFVIGRVLAIVGS